MFMINLLLTLSGCRLTIMDLEVMEYLKADAPIFLTRLLEKLHDDPTGWG